MHRTFCDSARPFCTILFALFRPFLNDNPKELFAQIFSVIFVIIWGSVSAHFPIYFPAHIASCERQPASCRTRVQMKEPNYCPTLPWLMGGLLSESGWVGVGCWVRQGSVQPAKKKCLQHLLPRGTIRQGKSSAPHKTWDLCKQRAVGAGRVPSGLRNSLASQTPVPPPRPPHEASETLPLQPWRHGNTSQW